VVYGGRVVDVALRHEALNLADHEDDPRYARHRRILGLVPARSETRERGRTPHARHPERARHPELVLLNDLVPEPGRLPTSASLLSAPRWKLGLKRLIDLVVAVLALIVLSPLLLATAVAVKLSSPGPVFFTQERIGKQGVPFRFVKFRTMRVGADQMKEQLEAENEAEGPIFKMRRDPRITPVGRILRKLSIDELPQLIHVVAGQMSLVGVRPPLPHEFEQYCDWERQRVMAKPGLTCIWQISGRSDLDFSTWVKLDLQYIEKWSLWLDFKILFLTVPAVLSGRGAY
jgi:lipopolysaccharide/colanic/teichoic acid biosynthesis glycosyltransferase